MDKLNSLHYSISWSTEKLQSEQDLSFLNEI